MADAVLGLRLDLAERAPERRVEEHGVVAEAAGAARRLRDAALHHTFHQLLASARFDYGDHTAGARDATLRRHPAQTLEQQRGASGVVEARPAEARGVEARPAVERIDLDARVIAQRGGAGGAGTGPALDQRVLRVGL